MKPAADASPRLITLILLAALSTLSLNLFLPSLTNIAQDLQADYALVSLSIAGYLAITAILQLVIGPMSDRFGRRPVLLCGLSCFLVGSLGCFLARDIYSFLLFRALQAGVISGWVLSMAMIRDTHSEGAAASLIGYVAMSMAIAPMLGPMVGGLLDEFFGWRASFLLYSVMGMALLLLCWLDLGETNRSPSATFAVQFQAYPELLGSRRFWGFTLCAVFSTGAFYIFLAGVPLVAARQFAISPGVLGFYMGTITAGFAAGSFVAGRYSNRYPRTTMMIAGRSIACIGLTLGLIMFLAGYAHGLTLFLATIFVGVANGVSMPSVNAGAVSIRPGLAGSAAGLIGASTVGGGALLTLFTGYLLEDGDAAIRLLGIMLCCSLLALSAAIYVLLIDRREVRLVPVGGSDADG
ncbi:MAG TPA: multidrug effflux MFS transporter [Gammaproteobacteria bacterium]|nr:multidrug effflux MFS transporter [Gammaproteobacteria bacterium]